jgi:hypothetical protein
MKATLILALVFSAGVLLAADPSSDIVAIKAAVSNVSEIRTTRTGFSLTTPSGTRNVYKTRTGYYIEGGGGEPNQQIIKTATGYRIESSASRGAAFSNRK